MDVRLPDGTVIQNVPEGTTQTELISRLSKLDATNPVAQPEVTTAERIAGSTPVRFALGAAAPVFAVDQMLQQGVSAVGVPERFNPFGGLSEARRAITPMVEAGRRASGSEGVDFAEMAGSVVGPGSLAATKIAPAASYLGKIAQGAGVGAGFGLLSPTETEGSFAASKATQAGTGAALGGFLSAIVPIVQKGGSAVYKALVEPLTNPAAIKGRAFLDAAGDKADELIALLRRNEEIVPGSIPTAGEAGVPAGRAEFAALQKGASRVMPSDYLARSDAQNAARLAAVRSVGKTPEALQTAIDSRAANAAENYGAIRNNLISPESQTWAMENAIASRAASKGEALRDWGRFATLEAENKVRGENFFPVQGQPRLPARLSNFPERAQEAAGAAKDAAMIGRERFAQEKFLRSTMDTLKQTVGLEDKPLAFFLNRPSMKAAVQDAIKSAQETGAYFPTQPGQQFSVENLQRMKMALDDIVKDPATFGLKATEQKEIGATRDAFVRWLSNKSPAWKEARQAFALESKPINQMQVGQFLEGKLVPALSDEAKQKAATYATALENAPASIKKATGSPRFQELSQVLDPKQLEAVNAVRDDLARSARFKEMATKGSQAAPDSISLASNAIKQQFGGNIPNLLSRPAMVMNAIINRLEGKINKKLAAEMAVEMLNPPGVARSLEEAKRLATKNKMIANEIQKYVIFSNAALSQAAARQTEQK